MQYQQEQACYDKISDFFTPNPHSTELKALKKILEQQFNYSLQFATQAEMNTKIKQVVLLKASSVKEGLFYFTMSFKGKTFIQDMKQFQKAVEYKGQRLNNVNLLAKVLDKNSYTPVGNPITDLKDNTFKMFGKKDMLNNSLFNLFSLADAKKLFFHLLQTPPQSKQVASSFFKLNVNYVNKSKQSFVIKTFRKSTSQLQVGSQQRFCYTYLCERGCDARVKSCWIMAVQAIQPSYQNVDKTMPSFQRQDYIQDQNQMEERIPTYSEIVKGPYKSQSVDLSNQFKQEKSEESKENSIEEKLIQQRRQSDRIQVELQQPNRANQPSKLSSWLEKSLIILILIGLLYISFFSSTHVDQSKVKPRRNQNM